MYLPSDEDPVTKGSRKKNRKRWCGGHHGREHIPVTTESNHWSWIPECRMSTWSVRGKNSWICKHEITCQKCGRLLQWNIPLKDCPVYQREYGSAESI